jgi:hypothetical protein
MTAINVRLPDSLHQMAKNVATQDHISLNQFIASAVAEKLSALTTECYLEERARRGSRETFLLELSKVPPVEPEPLDRIEP